MLALWSDINRGLGSSFADEFNRALSSMNAARRRLHEAPGHLSTDLHSNHWPVFSFEDIGEALQLRAEVPGFNDQDLEILVEPELLTIRGQRRAGAPEGYKAHRIERGTRSFSHSFSLSTGVDPERTSAVLRDGILTVKMEKAPESKARRIGVVSNP